MLTVSFTAKVDYAGGLLLGLLKAVLLSSVLIILIKAFLFDQTLVENSIIANQLTPVTDYLQRFLPGSGI